MDFIDRNGDEVLSLPSFSTLPRHVVQLIISRESLAVSEVRREKKSETDTKRDRVRDRKRERKRNNFISKHYITLPQINKFIAIYNWSKALFDNIQSSSTVQPQTKGEPGRIS